MKSSGNTFNTHSAVQGSSHEFSEAKESAYDSLKQEWQTEVSARTSRIRNRFAGVAASVVGITALLSVVLTNDAGQNTASSYASTIARIEGASINKSGTELGPLDPSEPMAIEVGDQISTGVDSRLAINWQGYGSLRLDQNSAITVVDETILRLERGSLYFDSLGHRGLGATEQMLVPGNTLRVETAFGFVEHVGTQFLVTTGQNAISIAVREGVVNFSADNETLRVAKDAALVVSKNDGVKLHKGILETEDWAWVSRISPRMSIDTHSTFDVLRWAAREKGLTVRYLAPAARRFSQTDKMVGLDNVDSDEALSIIPQITDLDVEQRGKELLVSLKSVP